MTRRLLALGLGGLAAVGALSFSTQASAGDKFAGAGTFAISADRLFGLNINSTTITTKAGGAEGEEKDKSTTFGLLWGGSPTSSTLASGVPRLSFDYFVIDGLSVGGSLGYISASGSRQTTKPTETPEVDKPSTSGFAFAPRAGYAIMFSEMLGVWPRAGITYYSMKTTSKDETSGAESSAKDSGLDLNIEALLVVAPAAHFALTVGPIFDLGISGSRKYDPNPQNYDISYSHMNFGLAFGLLGYL